MNVLRWWWGLVLAFALLALVRVFLPLPFANEIMIFSIYTMGCNYLLGRVGLHLVRPAGLSGRRRLCHRLLSVLLRQQSLRRHSDRRGRRDRRVVRHRSAVRAVARRLLRPGQSRAGGDHLLSDAEGAGRHHARRQRAVVPDQPGFDAGARPDAARPVLHLRLPGRLRAVGLLQISRRLDLRRLLPGDQDQRGQAEIPRLQQLQHPAVRLRHRQHDHRAGRRDVCRLSRLRQPGDHQPGARRRSGGGDDSRRRRHAVWADRRLDRLYRHEGRAQQGARQLGAGHRLPAGVHHARRREGHLGHAGAAAQKDVPARSPATRPTEEGAADDRPAAADLRRHLRPEPGKHLLPDDDRAVALFRPDAHHQPRPAAVLLDRRRTSPTPSAWRSATSGSACSAE